ncbi:MAG: chorismate-binding protein [Acidimicrobiia bacterium]|nr:chorismate-binding protein [Acidimicrobiia bacterium]
MSGAKDLVWFSQGEVSVGRGTIDVIDPGAGPSRYRRSLEALRRSGRQIGFASFTFDPDEPGSMVLIPEDVETTDWETTLGSALPDPPPGGRLISDGVPAWRSGFAEASARLADGEVEKVVLARRVTAGFESPIDQRRLLQRLGPVRANSYLFAVGGLIGASPELLVSIRDGAISAHPLAGTASSDAGLTGSLVEREHRLTADAVSEALSPHLVNPPSLQPDTVEVGPIKHLGSRITGRARPGVTIVDLLSSLHPTPAVGGVPPERALSLIRILEPWGRGRYAGPVGWLDSSGQGEFALALRCGKVEGDEATLFAGGGLVAGCDQEAELEETRLKLEPMLTALGLEPRGQI